MRGSRRGTSRLPYGRSAANVSRPAAAILDGCMSTSVEPRVRTHAEDDRSRRRWLVLAICCMSLFIVGLDNTIVNIALPSLRRDLGASTSGLQWIIDAYTLVLASLLVLAGSTADRVGRRRIFQTGLLLFTAGSL